MLSQKEIIVFSMQVLKKISSVFRHDNQSSLIFKRNTVYQPVTRLQKVSAANANHFPSSTWSKFVFISRRDGIGFQEETYPTCPNHIPLNAMVQDVNTVCQKQWQVNYRCQKRHPFELSNRLINYFSIAIEVLVVILLLLWWVIDTDSLFDVAWAILLPIGLLVLGNLLLAFTCYWTANQQTDYDGLMVHAIRKKLSQFNEQQAKNKERPDFQWTCHRDCLWIAIKINVMGEIF